MLSNRFKIDVSDHARVKWISLRGAGLLLAMLSLGAPALAATY